MMLHSKFCAVQQALLNDTEKQFCLRWQCANLMRFITFQVALFSVQWYFVQACSSMHFVLPIDKHRL